MKGNPLKPGGPSLNKPTFPQPKTVAETSAFFVQCVRFAALPMRKTLLRSTRKNQNLNVCSAFSESGALSPCPVFDKAVSITDQEGLSIDQVRHETESISSAEFAKM